MLQKLTSTEDAAFFCCCCHKKRQGNADRRKQTWGKQRNNWISCYAIEWDWLFLASSIAGINCAVISLESSNSLIKKQIAWKGRSLFYIIVIHFTWKRTRGVFFKKNWPICWKKLASLKALGNESTLLSTEMFPRLPACATFVADTNNVSDFVQKHFVSITNVSKFAQPKKHPGQQCVRNNVSSVTRALI